MRTESLNAKTTKTAPPPRKFPKPKRKTVFLPFQFKLKRPKFKILCRKKMPYHILISILALSKCLDCQRLLPQQPDPLEFNNVLGRNLTTTTQQITTANLPSTTPSTFSTDSNNFLMLFRGSKHCRWAINFNCLLPFQYGTKLCLWCCCAKNGALII